MESFEKKEEIVAVLEVAAEKDIPTLIDIENSISSTHTYSAMLTEDEWKEELKRGPTYLIRSGDTTAGSISYEQKSPNHVYISGLIVKPEFQGKGVARDAIKQLVQQHPDAKRFDLVTHPDGPGLKLYESLGFHIEKLEEDYFGDGEPRLILALTKE